jgi:hypothetical protein
MENTPVILEGYSDLEKGAYLGAIASIATADHSASEDELEYIEALCESAQLSESQTAAVRKAATDISEAELSRCLECRFVGGWLGGRGGGWGGGGVWWGREVEVICGV